MGSKVATKLKHYTNCTVLGVETGGGESGSNAILWHTLSLPETNIRVKIPFYHLDHEVEVAEPGRGLRPDVPVSYELEEVLNRVDVEMQEVARLKQTRQ